MRVPLCGVFTLDNFRLVKEVFNTMRVEVRNNEVGKALRRLKKKLFLEGVPQELRRRQHYVKPSDLRKQRQAAARKRARRAQTERYVDLGLMLPPVRKPKPKKPWSTKAPEAAE